YTVRLKDLHPFPTRRSSDLGKSMAHGYTTKRGRRYRYYLCQKARKVGIKACPGQLIAARHIEQAIASALYDTASQQERRSDRLLDRKSTRLNSSHVAISYAV